MTLGQFVPKENEIHLMDGIEGAALSASALGRYAHN